MFGSVVLDVAIGMAFVYLLLSLIAAVVQEIIASYLQLRSANLLRGIRSMFSGYGLPGIEDMADAIYSHGLIRGLYYDPCDEVRRLKAKAAVTANAGKDVLAEKAQTLEQQIGIEAKETFGMLLRGSLRKLAGFEEQPTLTVVSKSATLPSYIPSRTFAVALIDVLGKMQMPAAATVAPIPGTPAAMPPVTVPAAATPQAARVEAVANAGAAVLARIIETLEKDELGPKANKAAEALHALAVEAKGDLAKFQKNLENWFNDSMDRASGWYKRYIQRILLAIGLVLAVVLNVDSVRVLRTLWSDRETRQAMVNAADAYVKDPAHAQVTGAAGTPEDSAALEKKLKSSVTAFNNVTNQTLLPVGWKHTPLTYWQSGYDYVSGSDRKVAVIADTAWRCLEVLVGWLVTGLAISMGAPFWFDTLNKIMVVRGTVKPQEKSQTEASKD